ncbi:MAG: shikimate dehydrogenase [Chloroflexi bacterium]|nr:shikimate dehydrogenase [Chloroflexota bacterium]
MLPEYLRFGLTGHPLGHSYSPALHYAALKAAGLAGEYRLYPISPGDGANDQLRGLLDELRAGRLHGLNVTIPHKQAVIPFVDRLSEVAAAVGAVNTLYVDREGSLVGDNTDVPGFLRDLTRLTGSKVGNAVVLGAGGSARAVVYGLAQSGWSVRVLARRREQAEELVRQVGAGIPGRLDAEGLDSAAQNCDLLVNTTPLGMAPRVDACPWPENRPLPDHAVIYDLIYNPRETLLIKRARESGLPALGGAGMLAAQAALAFERWTGLDAPYDVMMRVIGGSCCGS